MLGSLKLSWKCDCESNVAIKKYVISWLLCALLKIDLILKVSLYIEQCHIFWLRHHHIWSPIWEKSYQFLKNPKYVYSIAYLKNPAKSVKNSWNHFFTNTNMQKRANFPRHFFIFRNPNRVASEGAIGILKRFFSKRWF